jgi:hypothetical protein
LKGGGGDQQAAKQAAGKDERDRKEEERCSGTAHCSSPITLIKRVMGGSSQRSVEVHTLEGGILSMLRFQRLLDMK